jgi:two-component system NtrC family sensor kinase
MLSGIYHYDIMIQRKKGSSRKKTPSKPKAAGVDIKKLKDLVSILSRGKYMWESTFDAIGSPVQIISKDFEIMRANLAVARVADRHITSIIGKKCYRDFAGRDKPCEACPLATSIATGEQKTHLIKNPIGGFEFEASAYPLGDMDGKKAAVVHYRDITEERRLQREVIQQEKMAAIGMLAGGVAHEINNPLGGIIAFTQLLKKGTNIAPEILEDLCSIEEAANRCKKIVADLLDFSRISKDDEKSLVDVNVILEKVFPFVRGEMKSSNVELVFDGAGVLPEVYGIPSRLQQVFLNLITNACHAMPDGGKLVIATSTIAGGSMVEIRVTDSGSGIPKEIRHRIFDPFFTTKDPGRGTGLGLPISYRIVKEHGGTIDFKDASGGGTEFIVCLPVAGKGISRPKRK